MIYALCSVTIIEITGTEKILKVKEGLSSFFVAVV